MCGQHFAQIDGHWVRPEEVVIESAIAVQTLGRVQNQQLVQQVQSVGTFDVMLQSVLDLALLVLRQIQFVIEIQFLDARPHLGTD